MTQRLPPLSALRAFASAGRHLSFQRAAAELAVTPTAISHQIRRLEEDLGVPLFRRMTRKLQLTDAGQRLLPEVAGAFERLASAVDRLKASGDGGLLTISAIKTFSFRWLAPRLTSFLARHPRYEVRLETSGRLVDFVREEIDLGIRHGLGIWPGLTSHVLFEDYFTPLVSPALLEKGPPLRRPADVLRYTLLREVEPANNDWDHWFAAAGVRQAHVGRGPSFDSSQLAVQAALSGLGIALVCPDFFVDEINAGRLVQPFPIIAKNGRSFFLVYPEEHGDRPKIVAFRDWLLGEVELFRGAMWPAQARRRIAAR
jgi:LysR family glycine cleavage system transcriptional activator